MNFLCLRVHVTTSLRDIWIPVDLFLPPSRTLPPPFHPHPVLPPPKPDCHPWRWISFGVLGSSCWGWRWWTVAQKTRISVDVLTPLTWWPWAWAARWALVFMCWPVLLLERILVSSDVCLVKSEDIAAVRISNGSFSPPQVLPLCCLSW